MEYWTEEALEKISRSLGTLLRIDTEIAEGDSYLYTRLQIIAVKKITANIGLKVHDRVWIKSVEIEDEKFFCLKCGRRNHAKNQCKIPRKGKEIWVPKLAAPASGGNLKEKEQHPPQPTTLDDDVALGKSEHQMHTIPSPKEAEKTKDNQGNAFPNVGIIKIIPKSTPRKAQVKILKRIGI